MPNWLAARLRNDCPLVQRWPRISASSFARGLHKLRMRNDVASQSGQCLVGTQIVEHCAFETSESKP